MGMMAYSLIPDKRVERTDMADTITHMCLDIEGFLSNARFPDKFKGMSK
jgi:hypothetical protein